MVHRFERQREEYGGFRSGTAVVIVIDIVIVILILILLIIVVIVVVVIIIIIIIGQYVCLLSLIRSLASVKGAAMPLLTVCAAWFECVPEFIKCMLDGSYQGRKQMYVFVTLPTKGGPDCPR